MFKVRFVETHTEGYRPAIELHKVEKKLATLLKQQKMVLSHTDENGYRIYVKAEAVVRRRRTNKPCENCGWVKP